MVVVGYHLAGDRGAPVAIMWGRAADQPHTLVVPEPRSRGLRFERLEPFAAAVSEYMAANGVSDPQIVVPNAATARWLFDIVGRFTWGLPTDGEGAVPASIPRAGKHLMFFGQERRMPGNSTVIAAVESLCQHFRTGQSPHEDLNLGSVLGWIRPPRGSTGRAAALEGEATPPAGPVSDPEWDRKELEPRVRDWNEASTDHRREYVSSVLASEASIVLSHAWEQTWTALQILDELPPAPSVESRRSEDLWRVQHHRARMSDEAGVRFRSRPDPRDAAMLLDKTERAQKLLDVQMILDDPVLMASELADGSAVGGVVIEVDRGRPSRPVVVIGTDMATHAVERTELYLGQDTRVKAVVSEVSEDRVRLTILRGANQQGTFARLPLAGQRTIFSSVALPDYRPSATRQAEIPWTHRLPEPPDALAPAVGGNW
jgi:hypothetical protein